MNPTRLSTARPPAPCRAALTLLLGLLAGSPVWAQGGGADVSNPLVLVIVFGALSLAPFILILITSFTKIVVVLGLLKNALGTQQVPPSQVITGLAFILTIFIMAPVGTQVAEVAVNPVLEGRIGVAEAMVRATPPVRSFMLRQTRERDLALFVELAKLPRPATPDGLPMRVVIPAYVISELKTGFQMGFFLFVPFLLIDLIVSTTLLSMGMMMLPPAMISLPFKVMLFVMIDGWNLLVGSIVRSFVAG